MINSLQNTQDNFEAARRDTFSFPDPSSQSRKKEMRWYPKGFLLVHTAILCALLVIGLLAGQASAADNPSVTKLETPKKESDAIRKSFMAVPPASATTTPAAASPALKKAWNSYYAALNEMRETLENTSMFKNPRDRAKAYHIIMEVQALVYNVAIAPRMTTPRIHTNTGWQTDISSMGLVGPDWYYGLMYLDGTQTYRLKGRLGDIKLFLIQVLSQTFGVKGSESIGNHDLANMKVASDGTFEVTIGGPKKEENWIPLDESSRYNFIMVRRLLTHYGNEDMGSLRIERMSPVGPEYYEREEFDETAMAERIHRAEMWMRVAIKEFTIGLYDFDMASTNGQKNAMALAPGLTITGGNPFSKYAQGVFSVNDDEALIVELDRTPDSVYWGFMLGDVWSRSLAFNRYQTSLNYAQAKRDADGHYRFVVSRRDPGVANWLNTTGRNEGEIFFRNYLAKDPVVPIVRKVKFNEIMANLPADTAMVSPEQRQAALEYRREGYLRLYGE